MMLIVSLPVIVLAVSPLLLVAGGIHLAFKKPDRTYFLDDDKKKFKKN